MPHTASAMRHHIFHRIVHLESHHRFGISFAIGLGAFATMNVRGPARLDLVSGWDAFSLTFLVLAWFRMARAQPRALAHLARLQHTSRTLFFLVVLTGAVASLAAVASFLSAAKASAGIERSTNIAIAVGTVVLSWLLVHTLFALYYAYLFYRNPQYPGGLAFPGTQRPDSSDLVYFSFVVGMTSQVSDVQISAQPIRRWATLHGVLSFGFNAAILGLSINIISGFF